MAQAAVTKRYFVVVRYGCIPQIIFRGIPEVGEWPAMLANATIGVAHKPPGPKPFLLTMVVELLGAPKVLTVKLCVTVSFAA